MGDAWCQRCAARSGVSVAGEEEQQAERRDQRGREAEEPHARAAGGGWRVRELHAQGARGAVRAKCVRMRLAQHRFARSVARVVVMLCARTMASNRVPWPPNEVPRAAASSHSASTGTVLPGSPGARGDQ